MNDIFKETNDNFMLKLANSPDDFLKRLSVKLFDSVLGVRYN